MPRYKKKIKKELKTINDTIKGIIATSVFFESELLVGVKINAEVQEEDNALDEL